MTLFPQTVTGASPRVLITLFHQTVAGGPAVAFGVTLLCHIDWTKRMEISLPVLHKIYSFMYNLSSNHSFKGHLGDRWYIKRAFYVPPVTLKYQSWLTKSTLRHRALCRWCKNTGFSRWADTYFSRWPNWSPQNYGAWWSSSQSLA